MTKEQAVAELKSLRRRDPFTPFAIVLSDGRRVAIQRRMQYGIQEWLGVAFDERERIIRFHPADVVAIEIAAPVQSMPEDFNVLDAIHELLDRRPFVAFEIVVASGDRYEITHRHSVAVGRMGVLIAPPKAPHLLIRADQIVALEVHEPV